MLLALTSNEVYFRRKSRRKRKRRNELLEVEVNDLLSQELGGGLPCFLVRGLLRSIHVGQAQTRSMFHVYPTHASRTLYCRCLGKPVMASSFAYYSWGLLSTRNNVKVESVDDSSKLLQGKQYMWERIAVHMLDRWSIRRGFYLSFIEGVARITVWRVRAVLVIGPKAVNSKICCWLPGGWVATALRCITVRCWPLYNK